MIYLFSYDNRCFVKCESITKRNRMAVRLSKLNPELSLTGESKEIHYSAADIFWQFCASASQNKALIYEDLVYSYSTISTAFKIINGCFQELGFPEGCYQGKNPVNKLCNHVTCIMLISSNQRNANSNPIADQLFDQKIMIDSPRRSVSILSDARFAILPSKASGYRCLYLYGEGGIGKTNFLHLLKQEWESCRGEVYFCSLSALLDDAVRQPIENTQHCCNDMQNAAALANVSTSYFLRFCGAERFHTKQRVTFLLDGLNELNDRCTSSTHGRCRQIMKEIKMLHFTGVNLVITSRSLRDLTLLPFSDGIRTATLSGVEPESNLLCQEGLTEESRRLITKPLFYQLFRKLNLSKRTLPQTAYEIWNLFHDEACRQETEKPNVNQEQIYYMYFILLPLFAHYIEANRAERLTRMQALRLMDELSHSVIALERYRFIINQIVSESPQDMFSLSPLPYVRFDMLRNLDNFVSYDAQSDSICFRHQDIREYFAAFHVVWFLKTLRSVPLILNTIPNFNLKTAIQDMVLSALGLHTKYSSNTGALYKAVFGTSASLIASTEPKEVQAQLSEGICFVYTAFTFSDHFLLHQHQIHYTIIAPFCESLIQCGTFLSDYPQMLNDKERCALLEAFSSLIMLYRMNHDYQKCREAHDFCLKYLSHGCGDHHLRFINHQRGKALLCYCQDLFNGQAVKSHFYPNCDKTPTELFAESLEILENCMPCNLTANTFGQLYETTAYWLTKNQLLERDVQKAFRYYATAYHCTTDPQYLLSPIGDDLVYTAYRMAGLLIKGYLRLEKGKLTKSSRSFLSLNRNRQNHEYDETIGYANEILSHIEGQVYAHIAFLRGAIQLYYGNITEAIQFFENDADYLLTKIVMMHYDLTKEKDVLRSAIDSNIHQLKKEEHHTMQFDRTDACYLLEDAKMLGYPV